MAVARVKGGDRRWRTQIVDPRAEHPPLGRRLEIEIGDWRSQLAAAEGSNGRLEIGDLFFFAFKYFSRASICSSSIRSSKNQSELFFFLVLSTPKPKTHKEKGKQTTKKGAAAAALYLFVASVDCCCCSCCFCCLSLILRLLARV